MRIILAIAEYEIYETKNVIETHDSLEGSAYTPK